MQGNLLAVPIHIPGTLTADISFRFQAPFDMQLVKVTAGCGNALTFILDIGTASTPGRTSSMINIPISTMAMRLLSPLTMMAALAVILLT